MRAEHYFKTQDVDFFIGEQFLVTVHPGHSRTLAEMRMLRANHRALGEGPVALLHRIVDAMVDHYRPEIDQLSDRLDRLEDEIFENPNPLFAKQILDFKSDVSSLRRVVLPQRDAVGRLARREFPISPSRLRIDFGTSRTRALGRRGGVFPGPHHQRARRPPVAGFQPPAGVMKVLTIITTIFMPLTLLAGMWGMNVTLPELPGGPAAQFWWIG